jgi:predicted hydrocarbon binding protein
MKFIQYTLILCFAFTLSACGAPTSKTPVNSDLEISAEAAIQKRLVLDGYLTEEKRVQNVAHPIWRNNAELCPTQTLHTGMKLWNTDLVPDRYKDFAKDIMGIDDRLKVVSIYNDTPAHRAGIKEGDIITAINGQMLTGKSRKILKTANNILEKNRNQPRMTYTLEREGETMDITINREVVCDYGIFYDPDSSMINAFADGENIFINRGFLRFAQNDEELAIVIAHELAHNTMNHIPKSQGNAALGTIGGLALDILAASAGIGTQGLFSNIGGSLGQEAYSIEFEKEADYIGMYYMARSGYDISNVAHMWRRMVAEIHEGSIEHAQTHPTSPDRFLALAKTYEEIKAKQNAGLPLIPEVKEPTAQARQQKTRGFN